MLQHVGDNAAQFKTQYGNVSAASIGAIQRGLLALEEQGGDKFFGEPALDLEDMMQTDSSGRGVINILTADKLINAPKLYATFLALAVIRVIRATCRRWATRRSPNWCFSSTRRILLFQRCARCLAGEDRAGDPPDSFKRRWRLLRNAESARRSRCRAWPIRQSRAACAARLYAARSKSREGGGDRRFGRIKTSMWKRNHGTGRRRGAGVVSQ